MFNSVVDEIASGFRLLSESIQGWLATSVTTKVILVAAVVTLAVRFVLGIRSGRTLR